MLTLPPAVETRSGLQWRRAAAPDLAIDRPLAEEAAVGILYDGRPHAVLMATPEDVEDLAVGFTLSERIARADQRKAIMGTNGRAGGAPRRKSCVLRHAACSRYSA